MCTKILIVFLNIVLITGSRIDTLKRCCSLGSEHATSAASCTFSTPIQDVEENYQNICLHSMEVCCKTKHKEIQCISGQEVAKSGNSCSDVEEGPRKECCDACKLGLEAVESEDNCASGLGLGAPIDEAFSACCKLATVSTTASTPVTKPTTTESSKTNTEETTKKTTPYKTTLKSMCGISDTCAQLCIPDGNVFRCDCRKGYTLMKDGVSCKPSRLSSRQNRCKPNPCAQKCLDTGTTVQCSCSEGYELDSDGINCSDIDECELGMHTCQRNETCINLAGDYECYDPNKPIIDDVEEEYGTTCPVGFTFNSDLKVCDDVDECEVEIICPRPKTCINSIGSYTCEGPTAFKCPPGFYFKDATQSCEDVDECILGTDDCNRKSQKCLNTKGNFTCIDKASKLSCPPGFKMDTESDECIDINECEENPELCGENEKCINEPGRYTCTPSSRSTTAIPLSTVKTTPITPSQTTKFKTTPKKIPEIDPTSENEISSFVPARTKPTTSYPKYAKTDLTKPITHPGTSLQPITCPKGYQLLSRQCVDKNECIEENTCDSNQDCYNTPGSYVCRCKTGFTKDYFTGACIDVNECQIGTHDCLDGQRCDNTIGSFLCARTAGCGTGYTLNYQKNLCEDDDECELNTHNCHDLGPEFVCRNTLGSYRCERIRLTTIKPNILQTPNTYNFINGQLKKCLPGYKMNSRGDCDDIDECKNSPCPRGFKCLNLKGRYQCVPSLLCMRGMELNKAGDKCIDIDECARGIHLCKSGQICENRVGFHVCNCPSGHKMNSRGECEDIDECQLSRGRLCYINAECVNTIGSYTCECKEGFYKNGKNCEDVDECRKNNQLCEQRCVNLWGSYRCSCSQGYTLNSDNRTCSDINECEKFQDRHLCVGSCENIPGSYACRCPPGYKLGGDDRTCQDIDECVTEGCPSPQDICVNTRGSYKCQRITCPPYYIRDPEHKSQCRKSENACDPRNEACRKLPDNYSYFFVTFGSNLQIIKPIEFLHIRAPEHFAALAFYSLKIVNVNCPDHVNCATDSHFKLLRNPQGANLAIVRSIEGPQDIELQFEMRISLIGYLQSVKVSKIFMFVSEYSF